MRSLALALAFGALGLGVLAGPAHAADLFTTIGITRSDTRQNSQINGNPPYSLPAEEMPPSGTVGVPPDDSADDVPLRMPDTSGTKPNLAEFRGQTLTLIDAHQRNYSELHFFGTTADGSGGGEFTLTYDDGSTRVVEISFPDWCGSGNASAHFAIGPLTQRYRTTGGDNAPCGIYHYAIDDPPGGKLRSVTLPPETDGTGDATRAYLMALTLEEPEGGFVMPDLTGVNQFPNDNQAPQSTVKVEGSEPSPSGWHTTAPRITIEGTDEQGGSGVDQIQYRVNNGPPQLFGGPFSLTTEGNVTLSYRSIDRAGNAETFKSIQLKVDATAPATTAITFPADVGASGWYDKEVTVSLRAGDGQGSGSALTQYRVNDGAWTTYAGAFDVGGAGTQTIEYRSTDGAGNVEATKALQVRVDVNPPATTARLNGAAPLADYTGAVRVAFTRTDEAGSGAVATEYRVNDGAWTSYEGAFDLAANQGYQIDYRSIDLVGNVENFKRVRFTIRPPAIVPAAIQQPPPAPAPRPFAAMGEPRLSSRGRLMVTVSCQSVSRGKLTLTVRRAVARRLKLKSRTLASKTVRCGREGRATVSLRPRAAIRRSKRAVRAKLTLRMTGAATDTQTVTLRGKS
jgi:hypothetical protein